MKTRLPAAEFFVTKFLFVRHTAVEHNE